MEDDIPLTTEQQLQPHGCSQTNAGHAPRYANPCNHEGYKDVPPDALQGTDVIETMASKKADVAVSEVQKLVKGTGYIDGAILTGFSIVTKLFIQVGASLGQALLTVVPNPFGCDSIRYMKVQSAKIYWHQFRRILGLLPRGLEAQLEYEDNYVCPTGIPGQGELNTARMRGNISDDEWVFGTRLNGNTVAWADRMYKASQPRLSVGEIFKLFNAGKIQEKDLPKALRSNGYVDKNVIEALKYLNNPNPSISEIMHGMIRNVDDQDVIEKYGLDEGFDEVYTEKMQDWVHQYGYDDETFKFLWRVNRPVIEQRIILRMYRAGQVDEKEMAKLFQFNGHSSLVAKQLAKAIVVQYAPLAAATQGKPTLNELEQAYNSGSMSKEDYRTQLQNVGVEESQIEDRISTADIRGKTQQVKQLFTKLRTSYLRGQVGDDELPTELMSIGIDSSYIEHYQSLLRSQKKYSNKQFTLSQLCKLVEKKFMDLEEYMKRAKNLGFNEADAMLATQSCSDDLFTKARKEQERLDNKTRAEAEKAHKKRVKHDKDWNAYYRSIYPYKNPPKPVCPDGPCEPALLPPQD